ncbi:hypothetical protein O0Q50_20295 [Priestia aryabhattai]|uniref:Uncharacterized protein n=1 Tax=Priestia aryabhattai TaxID=412384 RepID=A0AAX6NCX6_PRIAR|nr:hypothetical protein [Priestia aryabhattai]MDU9693520.1 hypothetical protein [Priestia aryabhattai]
MVNTETFDEYKKRLIDELKNIDVVEQLVIINDDEINFTVKNPNYNEEFLVDLESVWRQYKIVGNSKLLNVFIEQQKSKVLLWGLKNKTFGELKDKLIPSLLPVNKVSKEGKNYITRNLSRDFKSTLMYDLKYVRQSLQEDCFPFLPDTAEMMNIAANNLLNKGWGNEEEIFENEHFQFFTYRISDSYISHYQFFIKELIEESMGDCFFAFPTENTAYAVKVKGNKMDSVIESLNVLSKRVQFSYKEEVEPLSQDIVRYKDGEYEFLTKK